MNRSPTPKNDFLFPMDFNIVIKSLPQKDKARLLDAIIDYSEIIKILEYSAEDGQRIEQWKADKDYKTNSEKLKNEINVSVPDVPAELIKGLSEISRSVFLSIAPKMKDKRLNWEYTCLTNHINGGSGGRPPQT